MGSNLVPSLSEALDGGMENRGVLGDWEEGWTVKGIAPVYLCVKKSLARLNRWLYSSVFNANGTSLFLYCLGFYIYS